MYAGRVACSDKSWVVCAVRSIMVRKKDGTDRQTDGLTEKRLTVTLRLPLDVASVIIMSSSMQAVNDS